MTVSAAEARMVARDAYLAYLPVVMAYGQLYAEAVDPSSPTFSGGFGRWTHRKSVLAVSGNRSIARTILDSAVWLDLTVGPWELSTAGEAVSDGSEVTITDLWGRKVLHVLGELNRSVVIADQCSSGGPSAESGFSVAGSRFVRVAVAVELDSDLDPERTSSVQRRRQVRQADWSKVPVAGEAPDPTEWHPYRTNVLSSLAFWRLVNFVLTLVSEDCLCRVSLERAAAIGIRPGSAWDGRLLSPGIIESIGAGMDDALSELLRSAGSRPDDRDPDGAEPVRFEHLERALAALRRYGPVDDRFFMGNRLAREVRR
jgi:hypothetical protein